MSKQYLPIIILNLLYPLSGCGVGDSFVASMGSNRTNEQNLKIFGLDERAKVRVVTSKGPLSPWVDLNQNPTLAQSLNVDALNSGDSILLRAGIGYTNDVATKNAEPGSIRYKDENRYSVVIDSFIQMDGQIGTTGSVVSQSSATTTPTNHHGVSTNAASVQVNSTSNNVFNLVLKGKVEGGPTPKQASKRNNKDSHDSPPNGVPSVYLEEGPHRTKLDALVLGVGWESFYSRTDYRSDQSHLRTLNITRGKHFVSISVPLGAVKAGEIFDVSSSVICKNDSEVPQLCTHQAQIVDSQDKLWGEEITVKAGKNVPPGKTDTLQLVGAHTVTGNYGQAFLTIQTNTMSNTNQKGKIEIGNGSQVAFSRYTLKDPTSTGQQSQPSQSSQTVASSAGTQPTSTISQQAVASHSNSEKSEKKAKEKPAKEAKKEKEKKKADKNAKKKECKIKGSKGKQLFSEKTNRNKCQEECNARQSSHPARSCKWGSEKMK